MKVQRINLEEMLAAREKRAEIQSSMLGGKEGSCLVCLTLNIAGDIKRTPMTVLLFRRGVERFDALGFDISERLEIDEATGSEAFWLVNEDEANVKRQLEAVEDSFPAARLYDFDVLVNDNAGIEDMPAGIRKISRAEARKCLICGRPAAECARSRRHGLDAVKAVTGTLLTDFCVDMLAEAAYDSLLRELYTTPKPGLVDLANCGAHTDMDVPLFEKSAESLRPYFHDAVRLGIEGCGMTELRARGLEAEIEMFRVTGGVNTHKGAVYSMGLILAGMGRVLRCDTEIPCEVTADMALRYASELASEDAEKQLAAALRAPETNGGNALKNFGARGAAGEAAAGFPDAEYCASRLRSYTEQNAGPEIAGALAFCDSMARLEDTNLLHRGGREGLDHARAEASRIAGIDDLEMRIRELRLLDDDMIRRGLSPGGSADMLALAFLLERWRYYIGD